MVHEAVRVKAVLGISGALPPSKNSKSVSITSGTQDFELRRGQLTCLCTKKGLAGCFGAVMYAVHTNPAYNLHHVPQEET